MNERRCRSLRWHVGKREMDSVGNYGRCGESGVLGSCGLVTRDTGSCICLCNNGLSHLHFIVLSQNLQLPFREEHDSGQK